MPSLCAAQLSLDTLKSRAQRSDQMTPQLAWIAGFVLALHCLPNEVRAQPINEGTGSGPYVRNVATARAILRVGREERIIAIVRNPGDAIGEHEIQLSVPDGVSVMGTDLLPVNAMSADSLRRIEWVVQADSPVTGLFLISLHMPGNSELIDSSELAFTFDRCIKLPTLTYVPVPAPARTNYLILAHYCPLWKYGAHVHGWGTIDAWPERQPAIGFYDEGSPAVADWQIKYALEHGISGFIFVWDKTAMDPANTNSLGSVIDTGLLQAQYREQFKFGINWATNHEGYEVQENEVLQEILPFWLDRYFDDPSYLVIDGKPVLFIVNPKTLEDQLGGPEATRRVFDAMRAECQERGFEGLTIIGCLPAPSPELQRHMETAGYDASSAYDLWVDGRDTAQSDREGVPAWSHRQMMEAQKSVLVAKKEAGPLPDIVTVHMGWDSRPWYPKQDQYYMADPSAENFAVACRNARDVVDSTPGDGLDSRLIVLNNWNEFGEGHYIEPTVGLGFSFLDAVRDVFCEDAPACSHVLPEDVGLEPPDHVYRASRGILHNVYSEDSGATLQGDVIAHWSFDEEEEYVVRDRTPNQLNGFKNRCRTIKGVRGSALDFSGGGTVTLHADPRLYPLGGFAVEMWCKPDDEDTTVFLLNSAAEPETGYGIALEHGKPTFYVNWSQSIQCEEPIAAGVWSHLVAVANDTEMVLFVNGVEKVRSRRNGRTLPPSRGVLTLGSYSGTGNPTFKGALDEVFITSQAPTAQEVWMSYKRDAVGIRIVLTEADDERSNSREPTKTLLPSTPAGWRYERIELPPEFAPDIAFSGFEELRFAPGMFEPNSGSYFSYIFALRLDGEVDVNSAFVTSFLDKYYQGLCKTVAESRDLDLDLSTISVEVLERDGRFVATVDMYDVFVTGAPLRLNLEVLSVATPGATNVFAVASPKPADAPIWATLHDLTTKWQAIHAPAGR